MSSEEVEHRNNNIASPISSRSKRWLGARTDKKYRTKKKNR